MRLRRVVGIESFVKRQASVTALVWTWAESRNASDLSSRRSKFRSNVAVIWLRNASNDCFKGSVERTF